MQRAATASANQDEAGVIAKVSDVGQWEQLSEVRVGGTIGESARDGTWVVTGRVPISRIENVRQQPFVKSLKSAQPLQPALDATVAETRARPDLLPSGNQSNGAAGVVVGIVDYGGDFAHRNLRNAGGGTRFLSLWDQNGPSSPKSPFGYGREYTQDQMNAALQQPDPYQALGYGPAPDTPFSPRGSHGTHVADIAAGNGRGSNLPGVATNADLVFVDVSQADLSFSGPSVLESSFGDSVRLLEAMKYIFDAAGDRPCVINVSLGTNGGPHDGSTLVEEGMDRLIREKPKRAVTIAASNSFDDGIHATGNVPQGGPLDLTWIVPNNDFSHNEFELWYSGEDRFSLELLAPDGQSLGITNPGQNGQLVIDNQIVIFIANRLDDPNNHDNTIGIFLEPGVLPPGPWTVRLHGQTVRTGKFHAWIERDDRTQSSFAPPHDKSYTIGSISCGHESIVAGSYDAHKTSLPLSFFSSSGPTRDGRKKPELSAPGQAVFAAHSRTGTGVTRKSGTSMAAPAAAGIIALMLAEAKARGIELSSEQIRKIVLDSARRTPPSGSDWHPRYGHGRFSAAAAVEAIMKLDETAETSAPGKKSPTGSRGKKRAKSRKRRPS
ncbi:MAG: S8 family serine peptidase [Pirellulaceae bacterium]